MERKKFLTQMLVGGSILLTAPMIFNSCSKEEDDDMPGGNTNTGGNSGGTTIDLTDSAYSALASVGGYAYKSDFIIIRAGESNYVVLSKVCTHSGCTVEFSSANNNLPCPCHGSKFTIDGAVINGPATSALKKYTAKLSGNILTIT